ncbi:hypothetical protein GCM10023324_66680 [Streptomyces youssoufiensis]
MRLPHVLEFAELSGKGSAENGTTSSADAGRLLVSEAKHNGARDGVAPATDPTGSGTGQLHAALAHGGIARRGT